VTVDSEENVRVFYERCMFILLQRGDNEMCEARQPKSIAVLCITFKSYCIWWEGLLLIDQLTAFLIAVHSFTGRLSGAS